MELVPPGPPGKPKDHRKALIARRRLQVSELLLQGWSVPAIAVELREKESLIWRDKRHVVLSWRKATSDRVHEHQARLLAEIHRQKAEAWAAWEKSKSGAKRTKQRASPDAKKEGRMQPLMVEHETKDSAGDPRLLRVLERLTALEARLLGLLAPDEATPPPPGPIDARTLNVLVIGDAGLPADMPWLQTIPMGRAEPGRALEPPTKTGTDKR